MLVCMLCAYSICMYVGVCIQVGLYILYVNLYPVTVCVLLSGCLCFVGGIRVVYVHYVLGSCVFVGVFYFHMSNCVCLHVCTF